MMQHHLLKYHFWKGRRGRGPLCPCFRVTRGSMYERKKKRWHCNATCMHRARLQVEFVGGWGLGWEPHTAFFGFYSTMWCCHGDCLRRSLAKMAGFCLAAASRSHKTQWRELAEGTDTVEMASWEQTDRERTDISCYLTHIRAAGSFIFYRLMHNLFHLSNDMWGATWLYNVYSVKWGPYKGD